MTPGTVENARYADGIWPIGWAEPQALLLVDIDGRTYAIWGGHQPMLRDGGVNLQLIPGETDRTELDKYTFILAPDIENGRTTYREYEGATGDLRIVALARRLQRDVESGHFRAGKRIEIPTVA